MRDYDQVGSCGLTSLYPTSVELRQRESRIGVYTYPLDPPSPPSMESLMENSHLFGEPLLQDPDKEVVSNLVTEFGAPMIKKVLDLLRESTPFKMAIAVTLYSWSRLLFLDFLSFSLVFFFNGTCYAYENVRGLYG